MEQIARTPQQIGAVIRRQRRKLELTQGGLGAKTRHRQATLSRLEAGEPGARLDTLLDVLAALNLEVVVRPRTRGSAEEIVARF
jgi:HTH-type transcriptional regulator/antitoxin HipB